MSITALFPNGHKVTWTGGDDKLADIREVLVERDYKLDDNIWRRDKRGENAVPSGFHERINADEYKLPEGNVPGAIHTEWMDITPGLAVLFLSNMGRNRNIVNENVEAIKAKLIKKQWVKVHQGIGFYRNGKFFDGQHRMAAIMETGITMPFVSVNTNLPLDAYQGTDRGKSKSPDHVLQIAGYTLPKYGGVIKALLNGIHGTRRVEDPELLKAARLVHEGSKFVYARLKSKVPGVAIVQIKAVLVRAYYAREASRVKIGEFCERLAHGYDAKAGCPAHALREHIITTPAVRDAKSCQEAYAMTSAALNMFLAGETAKKKKIRPSTEEVFPLPWEGSDLETTEGMVPVKRSIEEIAKVVGLVDLISE